MLADIHPFLMMSLETSQCTKIQNAYQVFPHRLEFEIHYYPSTQVKHTVIGMYLFAYKKDKKSVTRQYLKNISYAIVPSMITYASLRTQIRYKYRQMSKLSIHHCAEKFGNRVFLLLVLLQSKTHCFPDHKIEMFFCGVTVTVMQACHTC